MASIKHLVDIDLNKNQLTNVTLQHLAGNPGAAGEDYEGRIFYDSDNNVCKFHNGTEFVALTSSSGDVTGVNAGNGISVANSSGPAPTVTLDISDSSLTTATAIAQADLVAFSDESATNDPTKNITFSNFEDQIFSNINSASSDISMAAGGAITVGTLNQNTTGTAAIATTVTVADESSDTSCNVLFTTAATGNLAPKSGTNLTFNSSSGMLTATGVTATFTGNITGNVTGNTSGSSGSCTGNAATATALATARNIGGVSFDGTGNINLPGVNTGGNQDTSGNAATATALETARNIGGVSFDGSGNIDLPGVNSGGNQDTSGNAATATKLAATKTIAGVAFDGSSNISLNNNAITNGAGYTTNTGDVTLSGAQTFTGVKTFGTTTKIQFRDANAYINSPTANDIEVAATTITLDAASDIQLEGNTTVTGNFSVSGTLNVDGTTTTVDSTTVAIADSMLKLAKDQSADADDVDFGFYGAYGDGTQKYSGIFRDRSASGNPFIFFDELQAEPGATVNTSGTGYDLADIEAGKITSADGFSGNLTGNVTGNTSGSSGSCTGNAATATALATARNIGGVSFDGTGNINLPGVNTSGSQDTSGNAATATALATARNINGVSFDGTGNITVTAAGSTLSDTVTVAKGGTGATSLTDGGILLGSGTGAVTAMAVLGDGEMIVGDGTTDPVAESGATLRASIGCDAAGTDNSTDVTLASVSGNYLSLSGQAITAGTVPVSLGGTGATSASAARTALGVAYATDDQALAGSVDTVVLTPGNLAARSYTTTVGGATSSNVDHDLGTRNVMVQLYDSSSYETVHAQVVRSTINRVVLTFNVAPSADDVTVLITKID
tara:strand:- start:9489 stop:12023 length:2535 start_codon:yes stop_codon:yes gene_type:complete